MTLLKSYNKVLKFTIFCFAVFSLSLIQNVSIRAEESIIGINNDDQFVLDSNGDPLRFNTPYIMFNSGFDFRGITIDTWRGMPHVLLFDDGNFGAGGRISIIPSIDDNSGTTREILVGEHFHIFSHNPTFKVEEFWRVYTGGLIGGHIELVKYDDPHLSFFKMYPSISNDKLNNLIYSTSPTGSTDRIVSVTNEYDNDGRRWLNVNNPPDNYPFQNFRFVPDSPGLPIVDGISHYTNTHDRTVPNFDYRQKEFVVQLISGDVLNTSDITSINAMSPIGTYHPIPVLSIADDKKSFRFKNVPGADFYSVEIKRNGQILDSLNIIPSFIK